MKQNATKPLRLNQPPKGFTLIEALIVVAILAILVALAGPSFQRMFQDYRVRNTINELQSSIQLARMEAMRRGGNVVMRRIEPLSTCGSNTSNSSEWSCGWRVFVDNNRNNTFQANVDTLIQIVQLRNPNQLTVLAGGSSTSLLPFDRFGQANGIGAFNLRVHPGDTETNGISRLICYSAGGRFQIHTISTTLNNCPNS